LDFDCYRENLGSIVYSAADSNIDVPSFISTTTSLLVNSGILSHISINRFLPSRHKA
ncbi:Hypothetical protein FKW44_001208, partial [Caligus rogercresseyi]